MQATIRIQADRVVAQASELLRGHFVEHDHRCLEGGIYEENSPLSDHRGFRKDVMQHFAAVKPAIIRYPGGNFSCDYDWRTGVAPPDQRGRRFNHGTQRMATHRFGTHEIVDYCREVGAQPMLTINTGTGDPGMAADWVAYCNADNDHPCAQWRRANGFEKPFNVEHWCIGNEIYGDWVPGTKTGAEYGAFAVEAGKRMRWIDPSIKLVGMATGAYQPDWDRASLDATVDLVDYVSLHIYVGRRSFYDCVGSNAVIQFGIDTLQGAILSSAAKKNVRKLPKISLDEYNVWYRTRHLPEHLEERFNLQDALTMAAIQNTLFRNAEVVGMACISMFTNVLGLVVTSPEGSFRQTIYWVLKMIADHMGSQVVDSFVKCPTFTCRHPRFFAGIAGVDKEGNEQETPEQKMLARDFEGLPYLDVSATVDPTSGRLAVSVVNRHETQAIETSLQILGAKVAGSIGGQELNASSVKQENSFEQPDAVTPRDLPALQQANEFTYRFPAHSYTVLTLPIARS